MLDALTDGGRGMPFFSPFSETRYFFPVTPIQVSPLSYDAFLSGRGLRVVLSEMKWVWLPAALLAIAIRVVRAYSFRPASNLKKK